MARVALIDAGRVENVVAIADGQEVPPNGVILPPAALVEKGWTYAGGAFAPPPPPPVAPPAVPAEVWTYQAKTVMALTTLESLGLSGAAFGLPVTATLYDAVLAAIATLPDQARIVAMIQLESAPGTQRDAPILAALAEPLGLTPAMIDQLFISAALVP